MKAEESYRIAMVAACPFPSLRGSQVLVRELAEGLANLGHTVHVVTYPTAQHMVAVRRIAIHRVPKIPGLWTARPFGWQKIVLDLLLVWLLYRVVRREGIQVIHAHNAEGPLVALLVRLLTGVPVIYHAHNALSDELPCYFRGRLPRRAAARLGAVLDHALARGTDFSVALTDRLGAFLALRGAAGRVAVVPPAVTPLRAGARPIKKRGRAPVIMYAGNLDPYQDLDLLVSAFDRVSAAEPAAQLVLVTHKATHAQTARRAARLAERPGVRVVEASTFAAACRELAGADVVACPRGSWSGFPIKVLNYMNLGRPVVQARASGHAVRDGVDGLLFNEGDPRSLARSIVRMLQDPALAARLGQEARQAVKERYSWSQTLPAVVSVYQRVVERTDAQSKDESGGSTMRKRERWIGGRAPREAKDSSGRGLALLFGCLALAGTLAACGGRQEPAVAPLPPLPPAPGAALDPLGDDYVLQPGDVVRVKYLYHPELDVKVPIAPDGTIELQGVGQLLAQGRTTEQLARAIEEQASDQLRDPVVTVIVAELGPRRVYVGGEVRIPGPVVYREGMTPLQAIMDRGGFTEVARTDSVLHLTIRDDGYQATRLDLSRNVEEGAPELQTLNVYDVVYVPRSFIGDANAFVRLYIRGLIPTIPRASIGVTP
jgi:protein involved in polysaccharide export with SLBB domain/glycosyltransferase involved in cell wall biosynthesis